MKGFWVAFGAALLLVSCSEDEGVGGLTAEESDQLNDAAAMLDEPPAATGDVLVADRNEAGSQPQASEEQ